MNCTRSAYLRVSAIIQRVALGLKWPVAIILLLTISLLVTPEATHASNIQHAPIKIVGNAGFTASNGVTGGSGTPSDAYIIQGWDITTCCHTPGIEISNTTANFVIRNVYIHYPPVPQCGDCWAIFHPDEQANGIALINATNGSIEASQIMTGWTSVAIHSSTNILLQNNGLDGLTLDSSKGIRLSSNGLGGNLVSVRSSENITISGSSGGGTVVTDSSDKIVFNGGVFREIQIINSTGVTVENNRLAIGVTISGTAPGQFDSNTITPDNMIVGFPYSTNFAALPILFYKDCSGLNLDSVHAGELIISNCDRVNLTNLAFPEYACSCMQLEAAFVSNMVMSNVTANTMRLIDDYNVQVSHGKAGVEIGSSGSVQVSDNDGPVSVSATSNVSIVNDQVGNGPPCGVCISNSYNVIISKVSILCVDCTSVGVQYSDQVTISASKLWGIGGIMVSNSGHVAISDNQIEGADDGAITLNACGNISIQRNQAFNPIRIDHCAGVDISDNTFALAYLLLQISSSSGMRIARNSFSNSTSAIVISNASNMTITANRIQSNREGVVLNNTINMQVFHNDFLNNAVQAVDTYSTQNLWDNGYPSGGNFWSNYNGTDNCSGPQQNVCGRSDGIGDTPYRFVKNQDRYPLVKPFSPYQTHGPIVIGGDQAFTQANGVTGGSGSASDPYIISGWDISSGLQVDGIIIFNTRAFFVIRHVYIHGVTHGLGVYLSNAANGRVEDSVVSGNGSGLKVDGSSNVTIVDNNFSNSVDAGTGMGLDIEGSTNILASGNVVSSNIQTGIYVGSHNVSVENNLVSSNGYGGIEIAGGSMIDISANNLSNNTGWGIVAVLLNSGVINQNTVEHTRPWGGIGIELLQSTGVSVFHNNLVGNPVQACDNQNQMKVCSDSSISPNRWDDGYPSGGNFWSNYNGTDTCSGPQQNVCGHPDGIGDTPMVFNHNVDHYPLMKPYDPMLVSVVRGSDNGIFWSQYTGSWSSWQQIPGATLSTPTLCPSTPEKVDLIVRGTDNSIYHGSFTNGVWSGSWDGPGGSTLDQPSCAVLNGNLYVAVRGSDNSPWVTSMSLSTGQWAVWTSLGGGTLSTPVLVATSSLNRLDLVMRGTDNGVWHMAMTSGSWSRVWDSPGGATLFTPAVVSDGSALQVVVTGTDHGVWYTSFNLNSASWSRWNVLTGSAAAAPALTTDSSGNLDLVVMGTDSGIWHKSKPSGGSWSAWDSPGGGTIGTPAVVQLGSEVAVLVTGTDHAVWFNRFGSGWNGWTSLGLATASAPSLSLVG